MKARVVSAVVAGWLLVAIAWGSQTAFASALQGDPTPLGGAIRAALVSSAPWVPVTLLVIWLTARYPFARGSWRRWVPVHLAGVVVAALIQNTGVVLGFWWSSGTWGGVGELVRQAAFWGAVSVHVTAVLYAAVAAVTQLVLTYREVRSRELHVAQLEGQVARARFAALNAQIRPHFLFNTLHTIGQLWRTGRSDDAEGMLDHLGALFQKVTASTDRGEIALAEELEMVEDYLAIERTRFRDRLEVDVDATPDARSCSVPSLILQPLVENAVRHGIGASSTSGRVRVTGRVEDGRLVLEVRDDGPGPDEASPSPGSGTGLTNTRERLQHLYGGAHALEIFDTEPGTCVRLVIPRRAAAAGVGEA